MSSQQEADTDATDSTNACDANGSHAISGEQIDALLAGACPSTHQGADWLLDLYLLLKERGNPGRCVRCFFSLLGDFQQPQALEPLRIWLEEQLQIVVRIDGKTVEHLPVRLQASESLEEFAQRTIQLIREDRPYEAEEINLSFCYAVS